MSEHPRISSGLFAGKTALTPSTYGYTVSGITGLNERWILKHTHAAVLITVDGERAQGSQSPQWLKLREDYTTGTAVGDVFFGLWMHPYVVFHRLANPSNRATMTIFMNHEAKKYATKLLGRRRTWPPTFDMKRGNLMEPWLLKRFMADQPVLLANAELHLPSMAIPYVYPESPDFDLAVSPDAVFVWNNPSSRMLAVEFKTTLGDFNVPNLENYQPPAFPVHYLIQVLYQMYIMQCDGCLCIYQLTELDQVRCLMRLENLTHQKALAKHSKNFPGRKTHNNAGQMRTIMLPLADPKVANAVLMAGGLARLANIYRLRGKNYAKANPSDDNDDDDDDDDEPPFLLDILDIMPSSNDVYSRWAAYFNTEIFGPANQKLGTLLEVLDVLVALTHHLAAMAQIQTLTEMPE